MLENVHVLGSDDLYDWCREPWPCSFERSVDQERRRRAQVCTCGHERNLHSLGALGLDACNVSDFEHGPPWRLCPCSSFRRAVARP